MKRKNRKKTNQNYTNTYNTESIIKSIGSLKKEIYTYKGTKNKTEFPKFVELCKKTQDQLKELLPVELLNAGYTDVVVDDGYIYAKGNIPVLLTAHMDTVHSEPVKDFYEHVDDKGDHIISSPQGIGGDDRCGIYMILELIKEYKPYILFCEDEESGGIGSKKFCKTEFINELADLRFLIELDRANGNDAVYYDCDNPEFTRFIEDTTGYKEAWGSFSDISNLAPACRVAAVNLSCGYYHAHTLKEEVNVEEMLHTIEVVKKLLTTESEQFEYIESKDYGWGSFGRNYDWYDDYDYRKKLNDYYGHSYYDDLDPEEDSILLYVYFYNEKLQEDCDCVSGRTEDEAWGRFFKKYPDMCYNFVLNYEIDYV
jgi:hypothetical protein